MYAVNVFVFAIYTSSGFDHLCVKTNSYTSICVCRPTHMCECAQRVRLTHVSITYCVSFYVWHLPTFKCAKRLTHCFFLLVLILTVYCMARLVISKVMLAFSVYSPPPMCSAYKCVWCVCHYNNI